MSTKYLNVHELGGLSASTIRMRVPDARTYGSDPRRGAVVEITIDWNALAKELAPKAVRSKAKKSRSMKGAVKAKVLEEFDS